MKNRRNTSTTDQIQENNGIPSESSSDDDEMANSTKDLSHESERILSGSPSYVDTSGDDRSQADNEPADPFDPERLRLSQDFASTLGVKKALLTIPVRKPAKEWFLQVHPDEAYRIETAVLELKEDRETYLVDRPMWNELAAESTFSPRALFAAINRQGVLFLWPIRLPGPDGKIDEWSRSALEAATMATGHWVRVAANMNLGAYDVWEAMADLAAPEWPDVKFSEVLRVAFKDRLIASLDHPVLRRLRGEV